MAKSKVYEPVSFPLEDEFKINYKVVGTKEWFDKAFYPSAILPEEKLIISAVSDLAPVKRRLDLMKAMGADTETTSKYVKDDKGYAMNPINRDNRIVLLQIGDEDQVYLIDPALIPEFKDTLESAEHLHILHNAIYDFKWLLRKYGIHLNRIYCSMLAEQVMNAGRMGIRVGLADSVRRVDPHYIISKAVRSHFIKLNDGMMTREMVYYAARDIPLLFPLFRSQLKGLKDLKLNKTAQVEFDAIPCTAEMELEGVHLDQDKLRLVIKYWIAKQEEMSKQILDLYTEEVAKKGNRSNSFLPELNEVFDLTSPKQKMEALKMIGFKLEDTRRETLLTVDHPLAKLLGEFSNVTKMTSTYGENMLDRINEVTGKWHPRFAQMGSGGGENAADSGDKKETIATGRYASDAQQFPRKVDRYKKEEDLSLIDETKEFFSEVIKQSAQAQKELLNATA